MGAIEQTQLDYQQLLCDSLLPGYVTTLLNVTSHELRRRTHERAVYAIQDHGIWYLPRFQFVEGKLVPGLDQVLPAIGHGAHPLALRNWFTLPHPDLVDDAEVSMSPVAWLVSGRSVKDIVQLADEITRGGG